jgi:RND family efflux transporter MFP subunit
MPTALRYALPLLLLTAAVAGLLYMRATRPHVPEQERVERVWPVAVVRAEPEAATPEIHAFGTIVAARMLELRPLVTGEVIDVAPSLVDGGTARAGQTLVVIDPFDARIAVEERTAEIEETRARIEELQADRRAETAMLAGDREQVAIAAREVERRQTLRRREVGSEKALDDAKMIASERRQAIMAREQAIERLAAQLDQHRARLAALQARLRRDEKDLARTRLLAPFDAFVREPDVAVGKRVGTGDRLATLIEIDRLEARFHLGGREFARLIAAGEVAGRPVRIRWELGSEALRFAGRIERLGAEIDPATGGMEAFAQIEDVGPDTLLRPGAFVEVWIEDKALASAIRLPHTALGADGAVYTVEDGRLVSHAVTVLAEDPQGVLVSGLSPGALVVTTRFPEMSDGLKVTARPAAGQAPPGTGA